MNLKQELQDLQNENNKLAKLLMSNKARIREIQKIIDLSNLPKYKQNDPVSYELLEEGKKYISECGFYDYELYVVLQNDEVIGYLLDEEDCFLKFLSENRPALCKCGEDQCFAFENNEYFEVCNL